MREQNSFYFHITPLPFDRMVLTAFLPLSYYSWQEEKWVVRRLRTDTYAHDTCAHESYVQNLFFNLKGVGCDF